MFSAFTSFPEWKHVGLLISFFFFFKGSSNVFETVVGELLLESRIFGSQARPGTMESLKQAWATWGDTR